MLSKPALVRVSDSNTMQSFSKRPTQSVIIPSVCAGWTLLFLHLDRNRHSQTFRTAPARGATDRRGSFGVKPRSQPDIACIRAAAIGRIKTDPADSRDIKLGPGMGGFVRNAGSRLQIARDITRRQPRSPRRRNQGMGMVLAHALALGQGLRGGGIGGCG